MKKLLKRKKGGNQGKNLLERKLTILNQVHQIQRELTNMKQQYKMAYAHASVQATKDMM